MFQRHFHLAAFVLAVFATSSYALAGSSFGIVDFAACIKDSDMGKEEQANFERLKQQMGVYLEETGKQLREIEDRLKDPEYMDGQAPEAIEELKNKMRTLEEEMGRQQNQYYQVLNQANMKIVGELSSGVNEAAKQVAEKQELELVINKDACFFYAEKLDITPAVVKQMNETYLASKPKDSSSTAEKSKK